MNFIKSHLIKKIEEQIKYKQSVLKHDHFYWFDSPIKDGNMIINRFDRYHPYVKNEILPMTWFNLSGSALKEFYFKLKNNEFFIYKKIDNTNYKARIKK